MTGRDARPPLARLRRDLANAEADLAARALEVRRAQAQLGEAELDELTALGGQDQRTVVAWFAEGLVTPLIEALAPLIAEELRARPPVERLAYSVDEAALATGLSRDTVNAMTKAGGPLRAVRSGGAGSRVLIPADALADFLGGRTQQADDPAQQDAMPGMDRAEAPSRRRA